MSYRFSRSTYRAPASERSRITFDGWKAVRSRRRRFLHRELLDTCSNHRYIIGAAAATWPRRRSAPKKALVVEASTAIERPQQSLEDLLRTPRPLCERSCDAVAARIGVYGQLRPRSHRALRCPILIIGVRMTATRRRGRRCCSRGPPEDLWLVPGAGHVDYTASPLPSTRRDLALLESRLSLMISSACGSRRSHHSGRVVARGRPCVFVRRTGCNLRCRWCESEYTLHGGERVARRGHGKVGSYGPSSSRSRGEPLAQRTFGDQASVR